MKYTITFFTFLISLTSFAQTYTQPMKSGETWRVRKNGTNVISFTADSKDSVLSVVRIKRGDVVPPPTDTTQPPAPQPSTYEGFGRNATGGSLSSQVILVSNGSDFNAAIGSNRTIKFTANASFTGRYDLIGISYLTIDANGFDVTIDNGNNGDGVSFDGSNTHHCILKGVRVINAGNDGGNCIDGSHDILIDHCSFYLNRDGDFDVAGGVNVTIQNTILGKGASGFAGCALNTGQYVSYVRNLFNPLGSVNEGERLPFAHCNYSPAVNPNSDIRNNVMMNWGRSGGTGSGYATAIGYGSRANVVNNYYYDKESSASAIANGDGYGSGATGQIYSSGNYITNGTSVLSASMANNHAEFVIPDANKVTLLTALEAKAKVKAEVGTAVKNSYEQGLINAI